MTRARHSSASRSPRWGARAVLVLGILGGVYKLGALTAGRPDWLGVNYRVFAVAGRAVLSGGDLYAVTPAAFPQFHWVYPPAAVAPYLLLGQVPFPVGFALHTLATLGVSVAFAGLLVRYVEGHGVALARVDRLLVGGFVAMGSFRVASLYYGQVNLLLAAAMGLGFVRLERRRGQEWTAGVALAVPAFVKVFPAAAGVWLLRRRAWGTVAGAVVAGVGLHLLGVLAFGPDLVATYVETAVLERLHRPVFDGGLPLDAGYVTLRRPVSQVASSALALSLGPLVVLGPVLAVVYRDVSTFQRRLTAVYATVVAVLLYFPSYFVYTTYLLFPFVPALYLVEGDQARPLFLVGAGAATLLGTPQDVLTVVGVLPGAAALLHPVVAFGSVPLVGLLVTLLACVLVHRTPNE